MTEPLQVGLDPKPLVEGLATATSALAEFKAAIASLNNTPTDQLKREMQGLTGAMQTLTSSLEGVFGNVAKQVESSMKSAQAAAKAGALELASIEEKRIEKSQDVNRRATNWFIAEQAKMLGASKETLSAIKNQSKAMWADKKAEETAEVKAYVSQVDVLNAQIKAAHQRQAEALNSTLSAIKNQSKAMWADKKAEETAEVKAYVSQVDVLNAQIKAAHQRQAEALNSTLSAIKNQSKAMWADKKAEETAEVKAYVSQVDVLNAQIKAAHQRQAEALNRQNLAVTRGARAQVNQAMLTAGTYSVSEGAGVGTVKVAKGMEDLTPAVSKAEMTIAGWGRTVKKAEEAGTSLRSANRVLSSSMHELHSASRGLASGFGAMWLTWGSIIPLLAGAAVSNAAAQALKAGADVGQSLATIQHLGGASTQEMQQLNTALLETSRVGPFGPREVAKALETMSLAGLSAKEQLQALKPVLDFSVAGNLPIEKAAESLLAISAAFGYQAQDLRVTSDVVAKTAAVSMTTVESMTASFKVASVVAQQYGISIQDVSVSLALLAKVGITGQAAGTAVRQMYSELIGSSKKAREVMEKTLNFDAFTDNGKALKPLVQMFTELGAALSKLDFKSQNRVLLDMGNERATKAIAANLSALRSEFAQTEEGAQQFASEIVTMAQKIADAPGFTAIAAIGMSGSTLNQMKSVASSFQTAMVEAFQAVEPAVLRVTSALQELFKSEGFRTGVKDLVSGVADFTGKLVEHMGTIIGVGKAYIVYQASLLAYGVGAAAGTAITNAMASSFGRAAITAGVMNLAILGIPGAAGAASTALLALNAAAGWVGVAALAITGAYAAYKLFFEESASGSAQMVSDSRTRTEQVTKGLDEEISRLNIVIAAKGDQKDIQERTANVTRQGALELVLARGIEETATLKAARAEAVLSKQRWESYSMLPGVQDVVDYKQRGISELDRQIADVASKTQLEVESLAAKFAQVKKLAGEAAAIAEERKNKPNVQGTGVYTPGGAAKEKLSAHEKISKAIQEELTLAKAQLDSNDKLSASEKYRIKTLSEINDQYLRGKTTVKEWAQEAKDAWEAADYKKQFEDAQAYTKMVEASTAAHLSAVNAQDKRNESLKDQIEKQRETNAAIGLSADAVGELEKATLLLNAAELDRKANLEDGVMRNQDTIDGLREQARLTRELANEKQIGGVKRANEEVRKEWEKTAEKINDSITDALMRGFESGKGFAVNLRDAVVNMFKTLVLRPTISAIVNPVAQGLTGMMGLSSAANAGSSAGSSALDSAGNILSAGNLLGGGGMAGSLMAGAGWVTGATTFGGALSAGASLLGTGTLSGGISGLGMIAGALGPIALGLTALNAIHNATQGEQRFGGQYDNNGKATNFISGPDGGTLSGSAVTKAIDSTVKGINETLKTLGSAQSVAYFNAGLESSGHGKGFTYAGGTLTDGAKFGQGFGTGYMNNRGDKSSGQAVAEFGTELKQATLTALQSATDIPKTISDVLRGSDSTAMFDAVTKGLRLTGRDIATLSEDITKDLLSTNKDISTLSESATNDLLTLVSSIESTVSGFNEAVKSLPFDQLKGLSFDAAAGLLAAAGGLDKFTTGLNSYYQNFYTAEERKAQTIQNINRVLTEGGALVSGVMPTTRDAFRKLVEAQDLTTESGQKAYVALLSVGDAFASVTSDVVSSIKKLLDDKAKIEVDLLTAQGNKDAARAAQRAIDIKDFSDAEVAAYDYNQSIKAQIAVLNERKGLQDQLDSVTLTSAQLLDKQRGALDASNQALFDQVQAINLAKAAIEANTALESARLGVANAYKTILTEAANAAAAVTAAQQNITTGYLAAQDAVANAQANITGLLEQSANAMRGFANTIEQFLTQMATTDMGSTDKGQQLAALQADFAIASAQARAGDVGALGGLTGKAGALLGASKDRLTRLDFAQLSASVSSTLASIAGAVDPAVQATDPAVKAQQDLASAQAELVKWSNAAAVSGASTAKATTDYLTEWRTATAANATAQADLLAAQTATQGLDVSLPSVIDSLTAAIAGFSLSLSAQLRALSAALAAMRVSGTGGTVSGAGTYTGTQALEAIKNAYAEGNSTPQIINAANVNLGVSSADLAKIADVAGYTEISAYQKRIDDTAELSADKVASVAAQAVQLAQTNGTTGELEFVKYIKSLGWNAGMGDKAMGWPNGTTNAWATANGLPAFAVGTNYVPRDMVAQIHEGEAIVPKAYNPAAGGGRDMARLEALMERLLAENAQMKAELRAINVHAANTADSTGRMQRNGVLVYTDANEPLSTTGAIYASYPSY